MVFVDPQAVEGWKKRYGHPREWSHHQLITEDDYAIIAGSQKLGRKHDVTLYIENSGQIAVIAKPFYPPRLYRAPSGGLSPNESLETGAGREAAEETGLSITLIRFLLCAHVLFECHLGKIPWVSYVFRAQTTQRTLAPTDHHEIREARWVEPGEFAVFSEIMRQSNNGGLHYRAALHDQIARIHPLFDGPHEAQPPPPA